VNETLILLLGQTPDDPVRWAFMAGDEIQSADMAPDAKALSEIAERAANARSVTAVLPGEQVAMRVMPSPPRAQAKFRAAAAFLLEDDLAENLDRLHVSVSRTEDGIGLAFAVKKTLMAGWRTALADAGISPDVMVPDFVLTPLQPDRATLVFERGRIIGAFGLQGFAAERPLADAIVVELAGDDVISAITAFGDPDVEKIEFKGKPFEWCGMSDEASLFHLYSTGLNSGDAPNFIQGDYRKRRDWAGLIRPWRRAAILAAACFVGVFATVIADAARSERLTDKLNKQAGALHQTAFPDQASANPREHARRVLAARTNALGFLPLSTHFAESLVENDKIQVDRIRFNAARGEYSINLRFSDINDLEGLKQSLADRGVIASEVGGVRRSGGFYVGELRVGQS